MPRVRCLNDPAATVAGLPLLARRIRRAHQVVDDRPIEDPQVRERPVPARPARYLLLKEYADQGRECGQAIGYHDDPLRLLADAGDEIADGWVPVEVHDLNTDTSWGVDLIPTFCGPRKPAEAVAAARSDLHQLADACGYSPEKECSVDALIAYKDAVEDRAFAAIAAGWSA